MARLVLTAEEKATALWSDLDDDALGKLVKKQIALISSASEQLERITMFAAVILICCDVAKKDMGDMKFDVCGLTEAGNEFGDWLVSVSKA